VRLIFTIILAGLLLATMTIVKAAWQHGNRPQEAEPEIRSTHGPDVSHCFKEEEERELWDCIRHE